MDLVIGNKVIITPMKQILYQLQRELQSYNGKLRDIKEGNAQNLVVTCPCEEHKGGFESHPSCNVFADINDDYTEYGTVHCFSCGFKKKLPDFVGYCFDEDTSFGNEWLLTRCQTAFISQVRYLPEIILDKKKQNPVFLDESILDEFKYFHPYMWQRKLTEDVVRLFDVGYNPKQNTLTFPVRDEKGRLCFITERSVTTKRFVIPKDVDKPLYLLYYIMQNNITKVAICEAQLDALTLWSYGIPAIATIGSPSEKQINMLNKSGIRTLILAFDNDYYGEKFCNQVRSKLRDDIFVHRLVLPAQFKDVNEADRSTIENCFRNFGYFQ